MEELGGLQSMGCKESDTTERLHFTSLHFKDLTRRPSVQKAGILGCCEFYFKYHPNYKERQMKPEYKKSEIGVKKRVKSEYFLVMIFSCK